MMCTSMQPRENIILLTACGHIEAVLHFGKAAAPATNFKFSNIKICNSSTFEQRVGDLFLEYIEYIKATKVL